MANGHDAIERIYTGRQLPICGNGTIPDTLDRPPKLEGVTLSAAGTYLYSMPTKGAAEIDVTVRPSAVSGTVTVSAYTTLRDGVTIKGAAVAGAALAAATQQTITIQSLRGVQYCVFKVVVAAASSVTFDQAEFSTL